MSRCPLDDSGYFEPQVLPPHVGAGYATVSGYDCGGSYRAPVVDKWSQPQNHSSGDDTPSFPAAAAPANRTWPDASSYYGYQSSSAATGWPQETAWHNYGPLTYSSAAAIDHRCQEPMMFYSWVNAWVRRGKFRENPQNGGGRERKSPEELSEYHHHHYHAISPLLLGGSGALVVEIFANSLQCRFCPHRLDRHETVWATFQTSRRSTTLVWSQSII